MRRQGPAIGGASASRIEPRMSNEQDVPAIEKSSPALVDRDTVCAEEAATRMANPTVSEMKRPIWHRALVVLLLLAAFAAAGAAGLHKYLDLAILQANREELQTLVNEHWAIALLCYLIAYAALVLTSLPGAAVMTIAGGFLFGQLVGSLAAATGATLGACLMFLMARSAFGGWMRRRAGPWLKRVEQGFAENGLSFLLVLRLIPLFPFFIVNLVLPFVGLSVRVFALGTFFGVLPASFVYASFGAGLGAIFDRGEAVTLGSALSPEILMALTGLGLLAMTPVLWRYWLRRRRRFSGGSGSAVRKNQRGEP